MLDIVSHRLPIRSYWFRFFMVTALRSWGRQNYCAVLRMRALCSRRGLVMCLGSSSLREGLAYQVRQDIGHALRSLIVVVALSSPSFRWPLGDLLWDGSSGKLPAQTGALPWLAGSVEQPIRRPSRVSWRTTSWFEAVYVELLAIVGHLDLMIPDERLATMIIESRTASWQHNSLCRAMQRIASPLPAIASILTSRLVASANRFPEI